MEQSLLSSLPKELKFIVLTHLDAKSLASLMQTEKSFKKLPDDTGFWKYYCLAQWRLSPEKLKKLEPLASTINWHREYKILAFYSRRIFSNTLNIRPDDEPFVKTIDEDPNSIFFHSAEPIDAIAVQSRFKLYPLPWINFAVSYYELTVEELNPTEPAIGIGMALKGYHRAFPGWGKDSYGLHGDNGHFYTQSSFGIHRCQPWTVGDTVGLGINHAKKEIFITLNGVLLGSVAAKVRNLLHMYATVGIRTVNNKCRVNFGQRPFAFNVVEYAQSIEHNEEFSQKWPVKLYSQIIQEFESRMVEDEEESDDVEPELIGGLDYYEKPLINDKNITDNNNGTDKSHQDLDVPVPVPDKDDAQSQHASHKTYLEWLFNRLVGFENEETARAVQENSPDVKEILVRFIDSLQFPIDKDQPLEEIAHQVRIELIGYLSSQYYTYLLNEQKFRLEREAKDPSLRTQRTMNQLDLNMNENTIVFIADKRFPDDHPLIKHAVRQLSAQYGVDIPDLENITWNDRIDVALFMCYRTYYSAQITELNIKRANRQKKYKLERAQKGNEFETLFGKDSLVPEHTDHVIDVNKSAFAAVDIDIFSAMEYCTAKYYGGIVNNKRMPTNETILMQALLWWHCSAEIPLETNDDVEAFREKCIHESTKRINYYEDDPIRCEAIMRGTIKLLTDQDVLQIDGVLVIILLGWIEFTLPFMKENHEASNEALTVHLLSKLKTKLENFQETFETLQKSKKEFNTKTKGTKINDDNKKDDKINSGSASQNTSGQSWTPIVAAISIVSLVLAGGAFYWLRNRSRK